MKLYHGTNCGSAVNIMKNGIDIKYSKKYLDFGAGFYTTPNYSHAVMTAIRTTDKFNNKFGVREKPYIITMDFKVKRDLNLSVGQYARHGKKWGQFVLNNRLTEEILDQYSLKEHNQDGRYDICYGEIADGNIVNIAYQVNSGIILPQDVNFRDFLKENGKNYPVQYSFHTQKGYSCIKLLAYDTITENGGYMKRAGRR